MAEPVAVAEVLAAGRGNMTVEARGEQDNGEIVANA